MSRRQVAMTLVTVVRCEDSLQAPYGADYLYNKARTQTRCDRMCSTSPANHATDVAAPGQQSERAGMTGVRSSLSSCDLWLPRMHLGRCDASKVSSPQMLTSQYTRPTDCRIRLEVSSTTSAVLDVICAPSLLRLLNKFVFCRR